MSHNYVVSAQKPTAVTHAMTGNFTSPDDLNLIVVKSTRIEIHLVTSEGLKPLLDVGIYGRIATATLFRPPKHRQDFLFLSTERYDTCVLSYNNATGEIITAAAGNVSERVGRPVEMGQIGLVDPECRVACLLQYTGMLKCIPIDENGAFKEAFNIRQEELLVLDLVFLSGCARPTVAVLYQDNKESRHLKTYELSLKEKEFVEGPWSLPNVESGASKLIPVPKPAGGVIVLCEQTITHYNGQGIPRSIATPATAMVSCGRIDPDGSRYLLGDYLGVLYILFLRQQAGNVVDLKLERVGETSISRALCYLDNGVVFVGSSLGDSQLIKLKVESDETGNFIDVLDSFTNLGPIVDFCVVDLDRQGQGQVVTCSGVGKNGSLRVVRNGVGINEIALLELSGINGVWSLRKSLEDKFDHLLAVSFVSETRFLTINGEELEETEISSFSSAEQSLFCGNVSNNQIVQITASGVRLVDPLTLQQNSLFVPPNARKINVASCNRSQILFSTGGGHLVYLEIVGKELVPKGEITFEHEIACINANPLAGDNQRSTLAAVGLWTDISVRLVQLPSLKPLHKQPLGGEMIPRSVLLASFEDVSYLLCGLGDGQLLTFGLDAQTGMLTGMKKITLGTQPVLLTTFSSHNAVHVFASSDHPTVIYSSNKKLLFSNVNLREVNFVTPLNSGSFPNSLAIAAKEGLTLGTIDEIQKLHIRSVPLGETPRRITHLDKSSILGVAVVSLDETSSIRVIEEQTFDTVDTFKLETAETACSIESAYFTDDPVQYLVVGTAFCFANEDEPTRGRVLVFQISETKTMRLVAEKEVKGAAYSLEPFNGKLLVAINNKVQLLKLVDTDDGGKELVSEAGHHGHVIALYLRSRGDFILVGDIVKSLSLLLYKPVDGIIEELARDFSPNAVTAVEVLDDDVFLGAENQFNFYTVKKNSEAATDDERRKLELVGQFHVGEMVNRFRKGSLVMKLPETEISALETFLFCTTSGMLGVLGTLPPTKFQFLMKLQTNLTKVIKGVGNLKHEAWRSFFNERRVAESRNFIDGDLIEAFLDLPREKMQDVVDGRQGGSPLETTVEDLIKSVEELASLH